MRFLAHDELEIVYNFCFFVNCADATSLTKYTTNKTPFDLL